LPAIAVYLQSVPLLTHRLRGQARSYKELLIRIDCYPSTHLLNADLGRAVTPFKAPHYIHALPWRTSCKYSKNLTAHDSLRPVRSSLDDKSVAMLDVRQTPSLGYRGTHS
jgi:hypothetical protein